MQVKKLDQDSGNEENPSLANGLDSQRQVVDATPSFTPGPWGVNEHGYESPYLVKAFIEKEDGDLICGLYEGDGANARLIAAAPALYAALIGLLPYLSTQVQLLDYASLNEGRASGFDTASVKAREALALATKPDTSENMGAGPNR